MNLVEIKKIVFIFLLFNQLVVADTLLLSTTIKGSIDMTPPKLSDFVISTAEPSKVYFNSSKPIKGSNASGFIISGKSITDIAINSDGLKGCFTVSSPFNFWDNNTIRYEGNSDIVDFSGNPLLEFTLEFIENKISEPISKNILFVNSAIINGKGDGSDERNASPSLSAMLAKASLMGGDHTIWIKAGTYKEGNLEDTYNGTATAPIKIKGYRNTIGDLDSINLRDLYGYVRGNNNTPPPLDPSKYPVFDGLSRTGGTFYDGGQDDYIIWKNLAITNYSTAFRNANMATGHLYENLLLKDFGTSINDVGTAFKFNSSAATTTNFRIKNCTIFNATKNGIFIRGDHNLIDNVHVYCTEALRSGDVKTTTDYYITISGSNSILRNNYVDRNTPNGWGHNGHGLSLKASNTPTEYNLVEHCTAVGIWGAYQVRHPETQFNVIKNSISHAAIPNRKPSDQASGLVCLLMGAKNNIFENMTGYSIDAFIQFGDNREETVDTGSEDNIVRNSIGYTIKTMFYNYNAKGTGSAVHERNIFEHITLSNVDKLYVTTATDPVSYIGIEINKSILDKIVSFGDALPSGFSWNNNNLTNGIVPIGKKTTSLNPQFIDDKNINLSQRNYTTRNASLKEIGKNQ